MGLNEKFFKSADSVINPRDHFNTVLFTGNNSTNVITTVGFQPDLSWFKNRQAGNSNALVDSVRGRSKVLFSDTVTGDSTSDSNKDLVSFDTDGFTLGAVQTANSFNKVDSTNNIVAWNWYAPTAQTNNAGSNGATIASTIKKNVTAGFSIVSYTGDTNSGAKIAHGLNSTPELIFFKVRTSTNNWVVYNSTIGATKYLQLDNSNPAQSGISKFNNAEPTASLISLGNDSDINRNFNYIAYCFHSVDGYSKIGSYPGNGTNQTIDVGFTPQFVMIKNTTQTSAYASWIMFDSKRLVAYNDTNPLYANKSVAEGTRGNGTGDGDVLEIIFVTDTGFKLGDASRDNGSDETNNNNETYIYYAIA